MTILHGWRYCPRCAAGLDLTHAPAHVECPRCDFVGYANSAPCYIPSERVLKEGGYEGGGAMIYYDRPAKLAPGLEQKIIDEVHHQLPEKFVAPKN